LQVQSFQPYPSWSVDSLGAGDAGRYLMKKKIKLISILASIIFILFLNGKKWFPGSFNHIYVQWLLIGSLVLLTSIGFVRSFASLYSTNNCKYSKIVEPIYFLFLFCSVIIFLGVPHLTILSLYDLDSFSMGHETKILEGLTSREGTDLTRKKVAQILYWEFGKKLPYLEDSGEYLLYNPSDKDILKASDGKAQRKEIRKTIKYAAEVSKNALMAQLSAIVGFFITTSITILVERHNIHKNQHIKR